MEAGEEHLTIDVFVDAFSLGSMLDAGQMQTPGRNDALDLAHFLYIQSAMVLATGDTKMGETARGIGLVVILPPALLAPAQPA